MRQVIEALACLAVAVIVFRAFLLEGYIISTGSMAPALLGYHKQVECPDCGFQFAFGVAFDRTEQTPSLRESAHLATCPNCGQSAINVAGVPRNDGDQLLVYKYAYLFGDPRRWEVVVFLNPNNPNQAYVKRVAGLPGETIHVRDGDVYINGQIQQKTMAEQRAIRIPVFDQDYQAQYSTWIPHWLTDANWTRQDTGFTYRDVLNSQRHSNPGGGNSTHRMSEPGDVPDTRSAAWVRYYHWPRLSAYNFAGQSGEAQPIRPDVITDQYGYNQLSRVAERYRVHDLALHTRLEFGEQAVDVESEPRRVTSVPACGEFVVRLTCRQKQVVCRLDADAKMLDLWIVDSSSREVDQVLSGEHRPNATVPLQDDWFQHELEFELSTFDRRAIVAVNGAELLVVPLDDELRDVPAGSWSEKPEGDLSKITIAGYSSDSHLQAAENRHIHAKQEVQQTAAWTRDEPTRTASLDPQLKADGPEADTSTAETMSPVAFGARRGSVSVRSVTLFRDVHYTTENHRHATERPLTLGDDEFFFLGDNSPVSLDSRGWDDPVVPRRLLVGRPLFVHLPSRPGRIRIGSSVKYIRVPDFSKIRCIR